MRVEGGGCRVEGGGWRVEGGGWKVEGGSVPPESEGREESKSRERGLGEREPASERIV